MSERRVYRWDVPVDDNWHEIGGGPVLMVACRELIPGLATPRVEVWTLEVTVPPREALLGPKREVSVFGTGFVLDAQAVAHLGSAIDPGVNGALVWHVFERGHAVAPPEGARHED